MDCLRSCPTFPWPSGSPDLSPKEHIWILVGRRVQPNRTVDELTHQLESIWHANTQTTIRKLYASMTRRVVVCIRRQRWSNVILTCVRFFYVMHQIALYFQSFRVLYISITYTNICRNWTCSSWCVKSFVVECTLLKLAEKKVNLQINEDGKFRVSLHFPHTHIPEETFQ